MNDQRPISHYQFLFSLVGAVLLIKLFTISSHGRPALLKKLSVIAKTNVDHLIED